MIFVTVGNSGPDFARLFRELDRLAAAGSVSGIFAQIGSTEYVPSHYPFIRYCSHDQLLQHIADSECVICHAGCGTLDECIGLRKKVIAVPRLEEYGEAADNHQLEILDILAAANHVLAARETSDLERQLETVRAWEPTFSSKTCNAGVLAALERYIQIELSPRKGHIRASTHLTSAELPRETEPPDRQASYVIITAAHNEAAHIDSLIRAVISQTLRPLTWMIVSDRSTDSTDLEVERWKVQVPWLQLHRVGDHPEQGFASKAVCHRIGYGIIRHLDFGFVANLDADVTLDPDFLAWLIGNFNTKPRLGIAGSAYREGPFYSHAHRWANLRDPPGQCQVFRRECWEQVGGYPVISCGVDTAAATTARMLGWDTTVFSDRCFLHHRKMGTASTAPRNALLKVGWREYLLGTHPLWVVLRSMFRLGERPYLLSGALEIAGFCLAHVARPPRGITRELVRFRRNEQMTHLRHTLTSFFGCNASSASSPASQKTTTL